MAYDTDSARRREELASDPYRPAYHFIAPYGWMNDPNGTVYWRGRWHLFYQYAPDLLRTGVGLAHWAHAVSDDLVHWRDLPIALTPTPGTYDEKGCWSGTALVEEDRVVACYHAHQGGNAIATACDELLTDWVKLPSNPIVPFDPVMTYDPCIWKEGETYYSASGRITGAQYGDGRDQEFGGKDIAYLYRSSDLDHWGYAGALYEGGVFTDPGEDCACPDFFPIGDRHMLLFLSHNQGAQYYLGSYSEGRFTPEFHGRMNFTKPGLARLGICGDLSAPIAWKLAGGRRVAIAWVTEGRNFDAMKEAGWSGILSLPRDISLDSDGMLTIEPVPELQALRGSHQSVSDVVVGSGQAVTLDRIGGNVLEVRARIGVGTAERIGLKVLRSTGGEEETVITVDLRAGTLALDPSRASLSPQVTATDPQVAPLVIRPGEEIDLRIFIDRSVVEVFANGRQCVTKRVYPTRPDSRGIQVFSEGGESVLLSLDAWEMDAIWPG